jgi:putative peptidoglycan lipid II flippase
VSGGERQQMQRKPEMGGERPGHQRGIADSAGNPLWVNSGAPPADGPNGSRPQKLWPDDAEVNPPWETESVRMPAAPAPPSPDGDLDWEWDSAAEQAYPSVNVNDMTGTGRIPAIVQLTPGASGWSKGVRAPDSARLRGGVAVDDQPSSQMRAMRVGNLMRATAIVTGALLVSRVLGLLRTSLFAYTFGANLQADAFTNAFTLPDTIFNIVAGGALASAFIPVFTGFLIEKRDKDAAWKLASSALNLSILALTIFAALAFVFADPFLRLTLPSLFDCKVSAPICQEGPLVVNLTRVMLLQPIFLGGATIAIAILQARQHFLLPAIGQVIYTVSLIGGIIATLVDNKSHMFGGNLGIYGPAWGVVAGAALQFVIQIPGLRAASMRYRPTFDIFNPGVREMFRLMAPRIFNAALLYVSVFVNRDLLGILGKTGITYGYVTAFTLVMLPIGVFGMAVSQAAFPTLAALVAAGEWNRLRSTIMRTIKGVTWLALPSSLIMIVLATPLTTLFLDHGSFVPSTVPLISQPLIFFSIGLLGLSLVEILVRSFYALHDSRTAVEVSVLQFLFVIGLSIILLQPMGASGLALATALGSLGEAVVLLLLLRPRLGGLNLRELGGFTLNVVAASVVAALAALLAYRVGLLVLPVQSTSTAETLKELARVSASLLVGLGFYLGFSRFLRTDDVISLGSIARRVFKR